MILHRGKPFRDILFYLLKGLFRLFPFPELLEVNLSFFLLSEDEPPGVDENVVALMKIPSSPFSIF